MHGVFPSAPPCLQCTKCKPHTLDTAIGPIKFNKNIILWQFANCSQYARAPPFPLMLQHTIRESRRLIYTTTSALRLLVVILCYPGAFAPSTPVPDPTPGVSGVFDLEVQEGREERGIVWILLIRNHNILRSTTSTMHTRYLLPRIRQSPPGQHHSIMNSWRKCTAATQGPSAT